MGTGALPSHEDLETRILAGRFRPIDVDNDKVSATGWAYAFGKPELMEGEQLDVGRVRVDPYIALFHRIETITVPRSVVDRELAKRVKELGKELDRDEERALEEDVIKLLRKRAIPEIDGVMVYVDPVAGRVYLGQATKSVRENVEGALEDLGIKVVINSPFAAGVLEERDGDVDTRSSVLGALYPETFVEAE